MSIDYCAASCVDSEQFERVIAGMWWEAGLEWLDEHDDDADDSGPDLMTVAVGRARRPVRASEIMKGGHPAARDVLRALLDDHDDYQLDIAYAPLGPVSGKPEMERALVTLADDIRVALERFETQFPPTWFMVEDAVEVSRQVCEQAAHVAMKIDVTAQLQRRPDMLGRWIEPMTSTDHAQMQLEFDMVEAAKFCGVDIPNELAEVLMNPRFLHR